MTERRDDLMYTCADCGMKTFTPFISTHPVEIVRCGPCYLKAMKARQEQP